MAATAKDLGYHQDWAWIRQIPDKVVRWFESGDLVPLLIVVSAVHYAAVLKGKDQWLVAIAIGLLVDLGHYRWVRAAARYDGGRVSQIVTRWTFALVMTGVSLAYHLRYYDNDLWLAAPIPLLIASLAWLAKVDGRRVPQTVTPSVTQLPKLTETDKVSVKKLALEDGVSERTIYRRLAAERKNGHKEAEVFYNER
jgi:hypothetical protein